MAESEKIGLINRLGESHKTLRAAFKDTDLELVIHPATGWRIKDILGHIATWDRQAASSLVAFNEGSMYSIKDFDEDTFNKAEVSKARMLTDAQILEEWGPARRAFIEAVRDIPPDQFPGDLLFPWGDERGTISALVEYMLEHDLEHCAEIAAGIQASSKDS